MSEVSTSFMEFGETKIKFTSDDLTTLKKSVLGDDYVGLKLICFKPRSQGNLIRGIDKKLQFVYLCSLLSNTLF